VKIEDIEPGREYAVKGSLNCPDHPERLFCRAIGREWTEKRGVQEYVTFGVSGRVFQPEDVLCLWEDWTPPQPPLLAMEALRQIRHTVHDFHYGLMGGNEMRQRVEALLLRVKGL